MSVIWGVSDDEAGGMDARQDALAFSYNSLNMRLRAKLSSLNFMMLEMSRCRKRCCSKMYVVGQNLVTYERSRMSVQKTILLDFAVCHELRDWSKVINWCKSHAYHHKANV